MSMSAAGLTAEQREYNVDDKSGGLVDLWRGFRERSARKIAALQAEHLREWKENNPHQILRQKTALGDIAVYSEMLLEPDETQGSVKDTTGHRVFKQTSGKWEFLLARRHGDRPIDDGGTLKLRIRSSEFPNPYILYDLAPYSSPLVDPRERPMNEIAAILGVRCERIVGDDLYGPDPTYKAAVPPATLARAIEDGILIQSDLLFAPKQEIHLSKAA